MFFVCGLDHFSKCGLHAGMQDGVGLVVLPRNGADAKSNLEKDIVAVPVAEGPPTVGRVCTET